MIHDSTQTYRMIGLRLEGDQTVLMQVGEFVDRVETNASGLIRELETITGFQGEFHRTAWRRSLPKVSAVLAHEDLADYHVHFGQPAGMMLEYRLPSSASWSDVVLLGKGESNPSAVILELKDWDTRNDEPGAVESLINHMGRQLLHPSDQVRGYVEYCQRFHSIVQDRQAKVSGCVYFTSAEDVQMYSHGIHESLTREYPVFGDSDEDRDALPRFVGREIVAPDYDFAEAFENGHYRQDRALVVQVSKSIRNSDRRPFVLLDQQRKGFHLTMASLGHASGDDSAKHVLMVNGPPGSGKSALAANLWAETAGLYTEAGNIAFVTTSMAQRTNWERLFAEVSGKKVAKGIVKSANSFNPGLNTNTWRKAMQAKGHSVEIENWRDNLKLFYEEGGRSRTPDDLYFLSIVDEAHALIDPTVEGKRGISPSGWTIHAGPQAWHIIRASRISVFLLDGDQSYRDNETTTSNRIREFAHEFGAEIHDVSLEEAQFRSGGAKEYMDWLNSMLEIDGTSAPTKQWRRTSTNPDGLFEFEIVDTPFELDRRLASKSDSGYTVRLVSSYSRPWNTKGIQNPHDIETHQHDFVIACGDETWSRVWNYIPDQDYSTFIQAPAGSRVAENPLAEVGCPYVIRGFDYDWLGVLWLDDLVRRDDQWKLNLDSIHESAWKSTLSRARKKGEGSPEYKELLYKLLRGYRIILSRAIHGVFVFIQDEETRRYVELNLHGG